MPPERSSWERIDLRRLGERERPTPDLGGLLYAGGRHGYTGESESAKTTVAYALLLEEIRAGGTPLVTDFEMGEYEARDRLRDMGAAEEELDSMLFFCPETRPSADEIDDLVGMEPTLVIVDAAAGAYSVLGLDDGKRLDVETFGRTLIRPFWKAGAATIVIDHVTKAKDGRGRYAIGSERKLGGLDVHLGFEAVRPLRRGATALVKIVTHKDRFGYLPRPHAAEVELRSDPETHRISWTFRPASEATEPGDWRPTMLMERVSTYLSAQPEPVSRSAVLRDVKGKRDWLIAAIEHLVTDGHASEDPGPRGAKLLSHIRPFPDPSPPFPGNGDPTLPPFPPAYSGDRGTVNGSGEVDQDEVERLAAVARETEPAP